MKIIPRVCSQLSDQANCPKMVQLCGERMEPEICTAKLVYKNVTYGTNNPLITGWHMVQWPHDAFYWSVSKLSPISQNWCREFVMAMKEDAWGNAIVSFFGG
jgi:hypothetical protein